MQRLSLLSLVATILLFTLNPFGFKPFPNAETWVTRFTLEDIVRNVLLFIPLGMAFRHVYRRAHWAALLGGFALSLLIETTQLAITTRTSNVIDLLSNSSGALLGSLIHQGLFAQSWPLTTELPFAMMFVSLCWVSGLRALSDPPAAWVSMPSEIASILLIQRTQYQTSEARQSTAAIPWKMAIAVLFIIAITIPPLFKPTPITALILMIISLPASYFACKRKPLPLTLTKRLILSLTVAGFIMAAWSTTVWAFGPPENITGTPMVLRGGELILFTATFINALIWALNWQRDRSQST